MTSAFASKPNFDKIKELAANLGVEVTEDIMQLGTNEAISNALVEIAVSNGKSETEIMKALGWDTNLICSKSNLIIIYLRKQKYMHEYL